MKFSRYVKPVIGLLLITLSVGVLFWWETAGREKFLMKEIYVTSKNIEAGEVIEMRDFKSIRINEEGVQKGSMNLNEVKSVLGKLAKRNMREGEQLYAKDFCDKGSEVFNGISIYKIKPEWIDNRSSSLRKGDVVRIYDAFGEEDLGSYKLAHVKSENEQEVVNGEALTSGALKQRDFSTSQISCMEIFCKLEEYKRIFNLAQIEGRTLLMVQEEANE